MFTATKNAMASKAAQTYLNGMISRYGRISDLRIDSKKKTIHATCVLHGEKDPIAVSVGRYTIDRSGDKTYLSAADLSCSRAWAQNLISDFVQGRRVELPSWAAMAL